MKKFIESIQHIDPKTGTTTIIDTNLQNVIITGGNGCGKTSFLKLLKNKITNFCVDKAHSRTNDIERDLSHWKVRLENAIRGTHDASQAAHQVKYYEGELEKQNDGMEIKFSDINEFTALLDEGKAIFKYFIAERTAAIQESAGAGKISLEEKIMQQKMNGNNTNLGSEFENHLVNLKTRQSFAKTYNNDSDLYNSFQQWFDDLESNISFLMEDESFKLTFDPDKFKFHLNQEGKSPYTFQTLSSGYSSIFSITSELIMTTEAYKIPPSELQGVVLIDEVDAHLHVSLQRKILPFLNRTYRNIQFIVTTHSPFVIGSLDDAIIYDMSSRQQFSELSNYSYETIIEGLLGVPVVSILLEEDIIKLSSLLNTEKKEYSAIGELVKKLNPYEDKLDDESAVFLLKARKILRERNGDK
ncbi:AAA family ATPase [Serratia marcescens]|nr:AAA family ATPase [Serratia marcescens]